MNITKKRPNTILDINRQRAYSEFEKHFEKYGSDRFKNNVIRQTVEVVYKSDISIDNTTELVFYNKKPYMIYCNLLLEYGEGLISWRIKNHENITDRFSVNEINFLIDNIIDLYIKNDKTETTLFTDKLSNEGKRLFNLLNKNIIKPNLANDDSE